MGFHLIKSKFLLGLLLVCTTSNADKTQNYKQQVRALYLNHQNNCTYSIIDSLIKSDLEQLETRPECSQEVLNAKVKRLLNKFYSEQQYTDEEFRSAYTWQINEYVEQLSSKTTQSEQIINEKGSGFNTSGIVLDEKRTNNLDIALPTVEGFKTISK